MNITPHAGSPDARVIHWIQHHYLHHLGAFSLLFATLRASDDPRFLRNIFLEVAGAVGLLTFWRDAGTDTFGLAGIAELLRLHPEVLELSGALRRTEGTVSGAFEKNTGHLYLYKMLSARHSYFHENEPEMLAWSRTLRIWTLVQALSRAQKGNFRDRFLEEICNSLRKAAESEEKQDWLRASDLLKTNQRTFDQISLHLAFTGARLASKANEHTFAQKHIKFFNCLLAVSRGRSDPVTNVENLKYINPHWNVSDFEAELTQSSVSLGDDEEPPRIALLNGPEEDDDDLAALPSDPDQTPQEQEANGNRLQLLLGAEARYVVWGWQKLNPHERRVLDELIINTLQDTDNQFRLVAAFTEIALKLGMSLKSTAKIPVAESLQANERWSIDISSMSAVKEPPRRPAHWNPSWEEIDLVRPTSPSLAVRLSEPCAKVLKIAAGSTPHLSSLGDLWPLNGPSASAQFAAWVLENPALSRLTPSMLAGALGQDLYEASGDSVFSRLFSASNPKGLPASTAYTAFRTEDVIAQIRQCQATPNCNAGGSLMDPVSDLLKEGFQKLHRQLSEAAQDKDPLHFHNLLAIHWDGVFRATTGIRPNKGIWKTTANFDWSEHFAFFNEKLSPLESSARLVPLLEQVTTAFRSHYLHAHLPALATWLDIHGYSEHALQIRAIVKGARHTYPAFLFILKIHGNEVKASPIDGDVRRSYEAPGYPLPWNVFRHWLRTQCHRNFLNVELVDSFIGHGDGATLTHGDFSDRVWIEDAVIVRKSIAIAYATLQVPGAPEFNWTNVGVKLGDSNVQRDKSLTFRVLDYLDTHAEQPQTSHKWRHQLKAARQARATIAAFLIATIKDEESTIPRINTEYISKGVASLKTEETTELSTRLIRERGNSPEILGQLRYAYFLWLIQRAWDRHGLHTKIVHRYQRTAKDESAFRLLIIGSLDRFDKFRNALNEIFLSASSRRLNNTQAYCLAALDLNISSRSSGSTLVTRLMDTKGFRLVTSGNNIYLEWNNEEDFEVGQAIQRLRISNRTATLLAQIKSAKKSFCTQTSMIPSELGELARILVPSKGDSQTITIGELLTSGCELINQRNSIQFPGTMSAFLSGRVKSASLPWQDWIAFKGTGRTCLPDAYAITASETDDDSSSTELTSRHTNLPLSVKKQKTTLLDGRKNIRELLKVIHEHLNKFIDRGLERTASINERRDLAIELRKDIRRFESLIPPTFYMLSNWAVALFYRKYSNKKRLLAVSSIRRYFDALASKFAALAGTKDLRLMHEDEIVSFYTDVLSIRSKDKSIYVYRRLRDFHRFVENQFGVSAINWGEIAFVAAEELCSPGYMEEKLYQSLLQYIDNDGALGYRVKTCTLALAIFAFRFGLREDEAMGMMRDDWVDQKDYHFVIVRRDTLRGLKTTAARRQVPLVFKLTSLEKKIFVDFRGQWREMSKGVSNAPLFCDPESPTKNVDATPIYSYLNEAIKLISSASHLSIHKLRHSFAARIWDALLIHKNLDDISWRLNDDKSRKRIRKILLGAQDQLATTRRSPWILAALMGHAHPLHAAFSYIHMQSDLAEAIAFVQPTKDWDLPHREIGVDLDTFTPQTPPQSAPKNEERPISLTDVLTVAGMLSDDTPILSIAGSLNLPFRFVKAVDQVFSSVSQKLTFRPREEDSKNKNEPLQPRKSVTQARENGPPPIPRYKAGSTGLLSHILASDRQIVAARLEDLSKSPSIQEEFSKFNIPLENFIGMFGSRRLISMWTQDQFRFVQKFLTALKLDKSSVCLASPPNVNAKVRAYCENSGLVNSSDIGKTSMSLEIYTNIKLDRVSFGDPAIVIIDRLALMLREDSSKLVKNRYQLIVLSVCVYLWCRWQSIVEKVDGLQI